MAFLHFCFYLLNHQAWSHFNCFSRLYSFFVMRMKLPCCGLATPLILLGFLKLRMNLSASQMR